MSKRLLVTLGDDEFRAIESASSADGLTVSAWVRSVLLRASSQRSVERRDAKPAAFRAAAAHEFPVADIDDMLAEIEAPSAGS